jgi:hypothetical protein
MLLTPLFVRTQPLQRARGAVKNQAVMAAVAEAYDYAIVKMKQFDRLHEQPTVH